MCVYMCVHMYVGVRRGALCDNQCILGRLFRTMQMFSERENVSTHLLMMWANLIAPTHDTSFSLGILISVVAVPLPQSDHWSGDGNDGPHNLTTLSLLPQSSQYSFSAIPLCSCAHVCYLSDGVVGPQEELYQSRLKDLDGITAERDDARKQFEDMRKQRLDLFMAGFSVITSKLKEMYQVMVWR